MAITPEWIVAIVGALGLGGGIGARLERWRQRRRDTAPLVDWDGTCLTVTNRIEEYLLIATINADGEFSLGEWDYDEGGSILPGTERLYRSRATVNWIIGPKETKGFTIYGSSFRRISLTASSNLKTIRSRRFTAQKRR